MYCIRRNSHTEACIEACKFYTFTCVTIPIILQVLVYVQELALLAQAGYFMRQLKAEGTIHKVLVPHSQDNEQTNPVEGILIFLEGPFPPLLTPCTPVLLMTMWQLIGCHGITGLASGRPTCLPLGVWHMAHGRWAGGILAGTREDVKMIMLINVRLCNGHGYKMRQVGIGTGVGLPAGQSWHKVWSSLMW